MSYYADKDGLRCDKCLCLLGGNRSNAYHLKFDTRDFCKWCLREQREDRRSFLLTWGLVMLIITACLWVLYSLPPTFD